MVIPATRIYIYPNEEQTDRIDTFLYKLREFETMLQNDIKAMRVQYTETKRMPALKPLADYKKENEWLTDIDSHAVQAYYGRYSYFMSNKLLSYVKQYSEGKYANLFPYIPTDEEALRYIYYFTRSESIKFKCEEGLFIPLLGFVDMDGDEQDEEEIHTSLYVHREDKGEGDGFEYFVTLTKLDYVYPKKKKTSAEREEDSQDFLYPKKKKEKGAE